MREHVEFQEHGVEVALRERLNLRQELASFLKTVMTSGSMKQKSL